VTFWKLILGVEFMNVVLSWWLGVWLINMSSLWMMLRSLFSTEYSGKHALLRPTDVWFPSYLGVYAIFPLITLAGFFDYNYTY